MCGEQHASLRKIVHGGGITPACAGNRYPWKAWIAGVWDHPRVCGEQWPHLKIPLVHGGSPPRVRGTDSDARTLTARGGITPACAGNRLWPMVYEYAL